MREVGVLEAKTTFSALVADIERGGEEIVVTRHGRPAVRIVRATTEQAGASLAERARALRAQVEARNGPVMDVESEFRAMRDDG